QPLEQQGHPDPRHRETDPRDALARREGPRDQGLRPAQAVDLGPRPRGVAEVPEPVPGPRRPARAAALAAALLAPLAGCASRPAASGSGGPSSDPPPPVAAVADERISKGELCAFVFARYRDVYAEALDELVSERLAAAEERRLPVTVPMAALAAAVDAEVKARAQQLQARLGDNADLEASVRDWYG